MVPIIVKLSDFISEKNYQNLQVRFLSFCEKEGGPGISLEKLKPNNFDIIYKIQTDFNEAEYHTLRFDKFISEQIPLIAGRILLALNKKLQKMDLVKKDELKRFIDKKLTILGNFRMGIKGNFGNLEQSHVGELHRQISIVVKKLDSKEFERGIILDKRIKLKWRKNDLLVLINLLRENGHIDLKNTITETGLAIDQVFAFKNSKTKEYQNYSGSAHNLEDVKRAGINKSLDRLKKVFTEDFFEKL
jgi:hypothetical protein